MIKVSDAHVLRAVSYASYAKEVAQINEGIRARSLEGSDYLGWADYPSTYDKEEFARIQKAAAYIRENFEVLVVCGIGGSYLGARAAIEGIQGLYRKDSLEIIFMGQTFAPSYVAQVLDYLKGKKFAINV
ncbi:MAG: glucose-6-phosphate isomerase, partial [Candidatus Enteromonas sp.]